MISEKLEAQPFAARILTKHLREERLAPTYLFTGEKASGKEEFAAAFAAALNCAKGNFFKDCDCPGCRKSRERTHPDLHWIGEDPKARSIKIEEVRAALSAAALKPYEGKWKVFILPEAGRLTLESSNALLKTLEEPPAHTLFMLLVESKAELLETIQSRCFHVRLRPLSVDEAADFKAEREEILARFRQESWDEFWEDSQNEPRESVKDLMDVLLGYFQEQMRAESDPSTRPSALLGTGSASAVRAVDALLEAKEALEDNANQKLALSRLAMEMRKNK